MVQVNKAAFNRIDRSLTVLGFTTLQKNRIYQLLASILHIGNLEVIEDQNNHCQFSESPVRAISDLLQTDSSALEKALLYRVMQVGMNGKSDEIV